MNILRTLTSSITGGAAIFNAATSLTIAIGAIYLVDCRLTASSAETRDSCYFTALPLMGVGAAGKGGFTVGYGTYNPSLRREESEGVARDSHGRFTSTK